MKKIFALLLVVSNAAFCQVNLNLGLRAYYPFSGNANDASGNNNNPVFNNAVLTNDRFGNPNSAYHFNGTDTYMRIPNSASLNMNNTLSISLWVKPTGWYTGQCYNNMMVTKGDGDNVPGRYSSRFSDLQNGCGPNPTTTQEKFFDGFTSIATTPIVQLNQWYNVVITFDGTTSNIYVNCILRGSTTNANSFTNTHDLFIGHLNSVQFPYWLNGDLDEIRIYDRALTMDEVNVLGSCTTGLTCTNWLRTQAVGQSVTVGDLDISGNQVTVEANFNCSSFPLTRPDKQQDIVSKHANTTDINYVLRMDLAGVTTTTGQHLTPIPCDNLVLNKTYHVAMVYDGTSLKFYRNGFLMSQVACTGNLVLNNWQTTIGDYAVNNPVGTNFLGYINEVRIWNVARTQAQLQTYMNTSLPNPTTQPGLQGYYTFDNLLNKQGNATYNGTLNNGATINNTNPNCTFTADSCAFAPCSNWLSTPSQPAYVTVGDLDIPGNTLTIEATANRTSFLANGVSTDGDLVSKHSGPANANYILRPTRALISTTNGFFFTPDVCPIQLNKTYHYAMVYDGAVLKFYRNGILMSQVAATGNLIQNDLNTVIAWLSGHNLDENFVGYINEVRIWNVARTQAEIQNYMNISLPNPTTQTGLLAYYTFNDLLNKQGNAAWNATLGGGASINATNPNCTITPEIGTLANAGPDTTFCSNTTVTYTLQGTGNGTSYSWTPAIYLNNPNIQNPVATINATTTFYLTVNAPSACPSIDSVTIYVNALPTVKSIDDTLICSTNPITLTTTGAQTYSWTPTIFLSNPAIANPVYSGNQSQAYIVTGTAANGCKAKDTVNVTVNVRGGLLAPPNKSMCGQSSVQLDGYNGNTVSYLWSPATYLSSTTIINPIANPPASTVYAVKISDAACNYDSTFNVQVLVGTGLAITVGKSNDIDCANRSATLFASGGDTYLWTPSTGLSNPNIPNPVATPGGTQKYIVFVSNTSGCSNTDSVTVFSNFAASLARYMPNAFTPNGDGLNDCYGLKNWMYIKKLEFRIFNRYGEQVFGTSDPSRCWDGKYKGKIADQGSYVYYIKAETNCGTEEQKGSFLLMR